MKILIACECSGTVRDEFRKLGHDAWSCDILDTTASPKFHIKNCVYEVIGDGWDMMIAHPPCTFLCCSGNGWMNHPLYPNRAADREEAARFFMDLVNAPISKIAVENPIGVMSSRFRKPDQIVQPWMFGDEAQKSTCLWLKGLPKLIPTNIVGRGEFITHASGKKKPKWFADALNLSAEERRSVRSKTFQGIAKAMAEQWGGQV